MLVTEATNTITTQISQGVEFLETNMQLWSKVQCDPLLCEFTQELQQKEEEFEQLEATIPTLILAQLLAHLRPNHALKDDLEELHHKKKVLSDHLKPWANEALNLSQEVDVAFKHLNQTMESVTTATEGPTWQKLVDIAQNATAQSEGVFPPPVDAIK